MALCQIDRVTARPLLKCLWPVLRREPGAAQFGVDPTRAVVVTGLTDDEVTALQALDGTRELPQALAARPELVRLLLSHGLVIDAAAASAVSAPDRAGLVSASEALVRAGGPQQGYAAVARRRDACVLVVGRGALAAALATLLRRSGVGEVVVGPHVGDDTDHSRVPPGGEPTLVALVASHAVDPAAAEPWRAGGIPVLPVVLHGAEATVGPLALPGGPCPRCLDLTRADLDPAWPMLLGQLTAPAVGRGPEVGGDTSLVGVAAAMAAMVGLAVVDGQQVPAGRSLEVGLPWPGVRQRQWVAHPRCSCATSDTVGQPADADPTAQARMAG